MAGTIRHTIRPGSSGESSEGNFVTQSELPNELISGSVAWIGGLNIQVSDWIARIGGVIYTGEAEVLTLSDADDTNTRIDVIVATIAGSAAIVEGTPAAPAVQPEVNPLTQVEIAPITVAALATTPSSISNEDVYLENTEWTSSENDSGTNIDVADTADPNTGSVHISFTGAPNGDYVELEDSALHSAADFNNFLFAIKNTVANTNSQRYVRVGLFNDTTRVSAWIALRHNTYSFNGSNTSAYQNIIVPIEDFALGGAQFDTVRFEVVANGANTRSFNLDDIKFQTGLQVIIQGVTQEDVDIAVLNKLEQITLVMGALDADIAVAQGLARWRPRYDIRLISVHGSLAVAPTGQAAIFDIHAGGVTIMSTNKIRIDATETDSSTASTPPALTTTLIAAGTLVTCDIDQIGSSTKGKGASVDIVFHQR